MTSSVFANDRGNARKHKNRGQRKKIMWVENYSGHGQTLAVDAALQELNIEFRFSPAKSTHLVLFADSFILFKIKDGWTKRWDENQLMRDKDWQNKVRNDSSWSGTLQDPGKPFYLQLAADSVWNVNAQPVKKKS